MRRCGVCSILLVRMVDGQGGWLMRLCKAENRGAWSATPAPLCLAQNLDCRACSMLPLHISISRRSKTTSGVCSVLQTDVPELNWPEKKENNQCRLNEKEKVTRVLPESVQYHTRDSPLIDSGNSASCFPCCFMHPGIFSFFFFFSLICCLHRSARAVQTINAPFLSAEL